MSARAITHVCPGPIRIRESPQNLLQNAVMVFIQANAFCYLLASYTALELEGSTQPSPSAWGCDFTLTLEFFCELSSPVSWSPISVLHQLGTACA